MKVLMVAQEAVPFYKTGGLGDVVGSLSRALRAMGVDVRLLLPNHGGIESQEWNVDSNFEVVYGKQKRVVRVKVNWGETPTYLMEEMSLITGNLGKGFSEGDKYTFFGMAVAEWLRSSGWQPHVVHIHDWHTGLIPMLMKLYGLRARSLLTIHNLNYQGIFHTEMIKDLDWLREEPSGAWDMGNGDVNLLMQGMIQSDAITTVSTVYAKEILTEALGVGLDQVLKGMEGKIKGILNGIDVDLWNPQTDANIWHTYSVESVMANKPLNKLKLQAELGLHTDETLPLLGFVGRLDGNQKGIDLLLELLNSEWLRRNTTIQVVVLGIGDPWLENQLQKFSRDSIQVVTRFDEALAHKIYAGSDMMLIPSRYEPCGLVQMIGMRYGAVPIVRATGGLAETVNSECGFLFEDYRGEAFIEAVQQGCTTYQNSEAWQRLIEVGMKKDFSWKRSANEYLDTYRELIER